MGGFRVPGPLGLRGALLAGASGTLLAAPFKTNPPSSAHITIRVTDSKGSALANIKGVLSVNGADTQVSTDLNGWILSNNQAAGAVTLMIPGKALSDGAPGTSPPSLKITPTKVTRGDSVKIEFAAAANAILKATKWSYAVSHTNRGSSAPLTATITRPANEDAATFGQSWQGVLVASGKVNCEMTAGLSLRGGGSGAIAIEVKALDPQTITLDVTVEPRTAAPWKSVPVENAEAQLTKPINSFSDTGEHGWTGPSGIAVTVTPVASGPNRGCKFSSNATGGQFTSSPRLNTELTTASSAFNNAQDKAYLTGFTLTPRDPSVRFTVRPIPRALYDINGGKSAGPITIKANKNDDFVQFAIGRGLKSGEQWSSQLSDHCISAADLLTGTRRHEYVDAVISHKANCLKALRALDPYEFAEQVVSTPGVNIDVAQQARARAKLILDIAPTHDVLDEAQTKKDNRLVMLSGKKIHGVNSDSSGNLIGSVWNPRTNNSLPSSP